MKYKESEQAWLKAMLTDIARIILEPTVQLLIFIAANLNRLPPVGV